MEHEVSNIISVPSKISENNHELILEDLIYINNETYNLNLLSPRPSLYFQVQHTNSQIKAKARTQSPNQLLCLLALYIMVSLESQTKCIQFLRTVIYSQNIIELINPSIPKYYKDEEISLATRIYFSKILQEFSKRSIDERLMLQPQQYKILNVWIVVLRNILFRSLKDESLRDYNTVITQNNVQKLIKLIKIKPSDSVRLVIDKKSGSMILIQKQNLNIGTQRLLVTKDKQSQNQLVGAGEKVKSKFSCCCNVI